MPDNTLTIKKYSSRDNDIIKIFDHDYLKNCPDSNNYLEIESQKLLKKATYTQMTTDELEEIKQIINDILKERFNNGKQ